MPHPIDPAAQRTRRRFRPAVVPTLAMLAAVAVFVAAGRWQQARMHEKEALRAQLDAAQRLAPAAIAGLPGAADWAALRFRPVVAVGAYRAAAQILIDNRVHEGRAGYVLVDRGWVAQGATRAELPHVPPPGGTVTVEGRLALPAARYLELQRDAETGPVRQHLDPARYAATTGIPVLPVVIEQTVAPVPGDGLVRDWPAPDFGSERHLIYMVQWYAFAALAVTLWVILNLRRSTPPHD
jgi:surfeit locus 1 family protein